MTKNLAISIAVSALLSLSVASAHADASSGSDSRSLASTENVNSPTFNYVSPAANPFSFVSSLQRFETTQAMSAGSTFVNAPAADTCALPGDALAIQLPRWGVNANKGGDPSVTCEGRADSINLKVTGAKQSVIKARQCQTTAMAEAFEDAGDPCPERLRPEWAKKGQTRAEAILNNSPVALAPVELLP